MNRPSKSTDTRAEHDSIGEVRVPRDRYWGAQTQRCLENFEIGEEVMPLELIHALGIQKLAAVRANRECGAIDGALADAIDTAAMEVAAGKLDSHFPLPVWQTGSGTQTNMNANEVIANRAIELMGGEMGGREPVHPNDHVNRSQSSNDTIPTAVHIAVVRASESRLLPGLRRLRDSLHDKSLMLDATIKLGRTHTQDAVPMTLGQEFSGYVRQLELAHERINAGLEHLHPLAQGGTAVGTGLNCPPGFAAQFVREVTNLTGVPFRTAENKFEAIATQDGLVAFSGILNTVATSLMKIANDIRFLSSGPDAGLAELRLPANEAGSSIMPGKVNPTQAEALSMVCAQVMGNHVTVTVAGSQGHFELNAFRPVVACSLLQSIRLLSDACQSFAGHCVDGITANHRRLAALVESSPLLATALVPHIGYDKAGQVAAAAAADGITVRDAAARLDIAPAASLDRWLGRDGLLGISTERDRAGDRP